MNNKTFLNNNSSFIKSKKRTSLIIKDFISNNIKQNTHTNKAFLTRHPSQKKI